MNKDEYKDEDDKATCFIYNEYGWIWMDSISNTIDRNMEKYQ